MPRRRAATPAGSAGDESPVVGPLYGPSGVGIHSSPAYLFAATPSTGHQPSPGAAQEAKDYSTWTGSPHICGIPGVLGNTFYESRDGSMDEIPPIYRHVVMSAPAPSAPALVAAHAAMAHQGAYPSGMLRRCSARSRSTSLHAPLMMTPRMPRF